jgi:hypothetical protein
MGNPGQFDQQSLLFGTAEEGPSSCGVTLVHRAGEAQTTPSEHQATDHGRSDRHTNQARQSRVL